MIVNKTIAVVGGGISSLSLLLNMAQRINFKEDILKVKVSKENINLEEEYRLKSLLKMKKITLFVQMWELITSTLKISNKKSFFKRIYQKILWWILNLFQESSWSTKILSLKNLKYKKPDTIMKLDSIKWLEIGRNKFSLRKP